MLAIGGGGTSVVVYARLVATSRGPPATRSPYHARPVEPQGPHPGRGARVRCRQSWSDVTLLDIAEGAGLGLADLRREEACSKTAILAALLRAVDDEVLNGHPGAPRARARATSCSTSS